MQLIVGGRKLAAITHGLFGIYGAAGEEGKVKIILRKSLRDKEEGE
jgi:hypothetical protein